MSNSAYRIPYNATKLLIPLLLAAAVVATLALSAGSAGAATSGGIAPGGDGSKDKSSSASDAKYKRLWSKVKKREKRWARKTARCESGKDPEAVGGGGKYRGAFQFLKSTWRRAPKSPGGDPVVYPYKTQAVVAVALKRRDGKHHWPNCG